MIGLLLPRLQRWASGLSYPKLLALVAGLFVLDVLIPDVIPMIDELLLGLLTVAIASRRKPKSPVVIEGEAKPVPKVPPRV